MVLTFSDYYFYLIAFIDGKDYKYPAFFRVDRIKKIYSTDKRATDRLIGKYDAGKMRNYLHFMYAGELLTVKVKCRNSVVTTFQNTIPEHWLIEEGEDFKIFGAKTFDKGFIRWILSQGDSIEILEPVKLRQTLISKLQKMNRVYNIES